MILAIVHTLVQDLRYAARILRRNVAFTFVGVLALALGIGINTAVFTAFRAIVKRPIEGANAREMVNIALIRSSGAASFSFSYPDYEAYRDSAKCFNGLIAFRQEMMTLSNAGSAVSQREAASQSAMGRLGLLPAGASNVEFASVYLVSENYFNVLGTRPIRGRSFGSIPVDELLASPVTLISENYFQRRFLGDPALIGRTVHLDGVPVTVIGITPHDFTGTGMAVPDFWMPLQLEPLIHANASWLNDRDNERLRLFGRLKPGITMHRAQAEMNTLAEQTRTLHDRRSEAAMASTVLVWPGSPFPLPIRLYRGLTLAITLIMFAAGMVLVVACANAGSLQLARARTRQHELHTRQSLGASRLRLIRQLLTESALLGLVAGAFALVFTWALLRLAVGWYAGSLPPEVGTFVFNVTPDFEIFLYVCVISFVSGILFGLAPAWESSRAGLSSPTRGSTLAASGRRLQNIFVATQVAFCLTLMIAGSMLIRSSIHALNAETGYDSKLVIDLNFKFPEGIKYTAARKTAIAHELRERLSALPGVEAVTSARPPVENSFRTAALSLFGETSTDQNVQSILHYTFIQPNYFETLGIPFVLGQTFSGDSRVSHSVIVSESAARQLWPSQNPVGRRIRLGLTDEHAHDVRELVADGLSYDVIGVVRDTRGVEFDGSDSKQVYLPLSDDQLSSYPILIRTASPSQMAKESERVITSIDADLIASSSTLEEALRQSAPFIASSFAAAIASSVGLFGLLLASMGIYGTVGQIVSLRTREIGIRMAIGAQKRAILVLILRESIQPVFAGLLAGMVLATGVSRVLRGVLYNHALVDFVSFFGVAVLFLFIALIASYPPARRALGIDPMAALRYE